MGLKGGGGDVQYDMMRTMTHTSNCSKMQM
jgi:hypothetical protein